MAMIGGNTSATTGLAKKIKDTMIDNNLLTLDQLPEETTEQYNSRIEKMNLGFYALGKAIVEYIQDNADISVTDPLSTVESYIAGVGTNGGSLIAAAYPVVGNIIKPAQTLDGTIS